MVTYGRCRHGISVKRCDVCQQEIMQGVDVPVEHIVVPGDGIAYTYDECMGHADQCVCYGCSVYFLYFPKER